MKPIRFREVNGTLLGGPAAKYETEEDVGDLLVCRTGKEIISKWRCSWKERLSVLWTGCVYLRVAATETHAPVCVEGTEVFEKDRRVPYRRLTLWLEKMEKT